MFVVLYKADFRFFSRQPTSLIEAILRNNFYALTLRQVKYLVLQGPQLPLLSFLLYVQLVQKELPLIPDRPVWVTQILVQSHCVTRIFPVRPGCVTRSRTVDKPPCYRTEPRHFWEIFVVEHLKVLTTLVD